jgi:hypothetical protein
MTEPSWDGKGRRNMKFRVQNCSHAEAWVGCEGEENCFLGPSFPKRKVK